MDVNKLSERVRSLLLAPRTEWPVIAAEPATVPDLYRDYIMVLAAMPPVCQFIKTSLIGYAWHGFRVYRRGIGMGLTAAIVEYAVSLVAIYVLAVVVDALAPHFSGQQNRVQALKAAAYAYTASWVAGFARLLPELYMLVALAGAAYSVYLLYLGLPSTMKVTVERSAPYTGVTVIIALVLAWIIALMTGGMTGVTFGEGYT
jgi:Yip1 domain